MKPTTQKESSPARPTREYISPDVNIYETSEGYVLQAEMPGVNKQGLEITLENNEITLVGHRQAPAVAGEALFRESRAADYRRVFELDPAIDTEKVVARMDQGVLTLTLPKSERVKPRRIKVD
ncbi:MAG TPA: Hsp20/alpha crystallin family protein [Verrucomicrobiota bacterium]|jgi:HSP20 family protein|nr:Hsp20/alpha crystallin family protein [Verrucomicrobiota bacterium]HRR57445.1 Hsp20/alpha crystallin family protein [Acidobacteriota bacterium]